MEKLKLKIRLIFIYYIKLKKTKMKRTKYINILYTYNKFVYKYVQFININSYIIEIESGSNY